MENALIGLLITAIILAVIFGIIWAIMRLALPALGSPWGRIVELLFYGVVAIVVIVKILMPLLEMV